MATVITKYECGLCGELHDEEEDARSCCSPEVRELFKCSDCDEVFLDEMDAGEHCSSHYDDKPDMPTHAELEAAGQQRLSL